ncbi:MAG: hypothetical protein JOZ16_02370 [Methylobacteriaceae bacterium]|nr:hypothetical protein [Methylobacteriaceae bacterium]
MVGTEIFLGIIAIRLAALALLGLILVALPVSSGNPQLAFLDRNQASIDALAAPAAREQRVQDDALRDMLLHD